MSEIKHLQNGRKGAFAFIKDEKKLAEMVYTMAGEKKLIIEHTEVDAELRGQGVGKRLLLQLVDFARQNQLKVVPLCPFANKLIKQDKQLQDVL